MKYLMLQPMFSQAEGIIKKLQVPVATLKIWLIRRAHKNILTPGAFLHKYNILMNKHKSK